MRQVSNSLLTLCPIPFAFPNASAFPRDIAGVNGFRFTPFFIRRENAPFQICILPGLSCSPRSIVRIGLGEGSVRNLLHAVRFVLPVLALIILFAPALNAAHALVVALKQDVAVGSDVICLGDIADIHGLDSDAAGRLGRVELGPSPEFGKISEWSRQQIYAKIPNSLVRGGLSFEGAPAVQIRRQGKHLRPDDIAGALKGYITATTLWKEAEIEIRAIGNLNEIELPPGDTQLRLGPGTTAVGRNRLLVNFEAIQEEKVQRSFWINVDISIRARVLTAARKIPYNIAITSEDIAESIVDIADFRNAYIRQSDELIGKVSRRGFSPGDLFTREAFTDPFLVRHGETVQLRLERNGIVLVASAKAEQDGKLGQTIVVRNLEFSTALKAKVVGPGSVKIQ